VACEARGLASAGISCDGKAQLILKFQVLPMERGSCYLAWGENRQRISHFQRAAEEILVGGTNGFDGGLVARLDETGRAG